MRDCVIQVRARRIEVDPAYRCAHAGYACYQGKKMISVRQMKAARALLGWSQGDLDTASGISAPTIARLEAEDGPVGCRAEAVAALARAGVQFIQKNGGAGGYG